MNMDPIGWLDARPAAPMPAAKLMARAHAEGFWDAFREAVVSVQHENADTVLLRIHLPDWLAAIVRQQQLPGR